MGAVRDLVPALDPAPTLYMPMPQRPWPFLTFLAKTQGGDPTAIIAGLRRAIREAAPATPVPEITPLAGNFTAAIAPRAFTTWVLVAFAAHRTAARGYRDLRRHFLQRRSANAGEWAFVLR